MYQKQDIAKRGTLTRAEYSRLYRLKNRSRLREYGKQWEMLNHEHMLIRARAWKQKDYWKDPEKYRRKRRERYKNNREHYLFKVHVRYYAKKAGTDLTEEQWGAIKKAYHFACAYCGAKGLRLSIEHVVPVSRGGKTTASNIVPACMPCNARKSDKEPPLIPAKRLLL